MQVYGSQWYLLLAQKKKKKEKKRKSANMKLINPREGQDLEGEV